MEQVFTPLNETKTVRLKYPLKEVKVLSGDLDIRKIGLKAIIEIYNQKYEVYGKACGLPNCQCDSYIKLIK